MQKSLVRKGLVLGIIILFVGASVIPSTVGTVEKKTTFTNATSGGYIQNLIDNASDGDTIYIPSGTYYENIVINKSISLIGENKENTIIDGGGVDDVVYVYTDWVNISGFTIRKSEWNEAGIDIYTNYNTILNNTISDNNIGLCLLGNSNYITNNIISNNDRGIWLEDSSSNFISGNIISNNDYGIRPPWPKSSDNNIVTDNTITSNKNSGITLSGFNNIITCNTLSNNGGGIGISDFTGEGSNNTIITGNNISNNNGGLSVYHSRNTVMRNNTIQENTCNFGVSGEELSHFYQDIDITNTIDGKPIYYLIEQSDLVFDDTMSIGYLGLIKCTNISVKNLILTKNTQGLLLANTSYSKIENCIFNNNYQDGIYLRSSGGNAITDNNISNNGPGSFGGRGIDLTSSNNNTIIGNIILNNGNLYCGDGIFLHNTSGTNISSNTISSNKRNGIDISSSDNNTIIGNIISKNGDGISLGFSSSNIITFNNVSSNNGSGISLGGSSNTITGNNIVSNNRYGIRLSSSRDSIIKSNNIISNDKGSIFLLSSGSNIIRENNFRDNERQLTFFDGDWKNTWMQNYWNSPRLLPKFILGIIWIPTSGPPGIPTPPIPFPWFTFDWRPALSPYDIGV